MTLTEVREAGHMPRFPTKLVRKEDTHAWRDTETRKDSGSPINIQNAVLLCLTVSSEPVLFRYMSKKIPLCTSARFFVTKTKRLVIDL